MFVIIFESFIIWHLNIIYDLSFMNMGWKVPRWTFNDSLSFVIYPLQLKAFSHVMSSMITISITYEIIDLKFSFNERCVIERGDDFQMPYNMVPWKVRNVPYLQRVKTRHLYLGICKLFLFTLKGALCFS